MLPSTLKINQIMTRHDCSDSAVPRISLKIDHQPLQLDPIRGIVSRQREIGIGIHVEEVDVSDK